MMDFSNRMIRVAGQTVKVKTHGGSELVNKDISDAMERVSPMIAWWSSVKAAAIQEYEQADAVYRQWRARAALEILNKNEKLAEWKVRTMIDALPDFFRYKKAISLAKENIELAGGMVKAFEKRANILQSRGANLRAERRTQDLHTPEQDPDENDDEDQKVSLDDPSSGHGVDDDEEGEDDFPPSWGGKGKPSTSNESYAVKADRLKQRAAKRRAEKKAVAESLILSKGSPEPPAKRAPAKKAKRRRTRKPSCVVDI